MPTVARATAADRFLVAAAVVFGLAVGNHSLTLLLAIPVGLYVLAVEPGIWRRRGSSSTCVAALASTLALVYLELPLRAGRSGRRSSTDDPDTWEGFWYVVLAEQFQGSLSDPFGDLPTKVGAARVAWTVAAVRDPRAAHPGRPSSPPSCAGRATRS